MKTKLTRMAPLSVAKIYGIIMAVFGLVIGAFVSIAALFGGLASMAAETGGGFFGLFFGVMAILFFPLFYGAIGFISGAIAAWLYNIAAGWIGGIEMEFEMDGDASS